MNTPANPSRDKLLDRLADRLFVRTTVTEIEPIAARMRRIRLNGPQLATLTCTPGQQVRVMVTDAFTVGAVRQAFRDVLRTYSVWSHDPTTARLDLCVLDHGDGPGARWARQLTIGDDVRFKGPEGHFVLADAPYHLFIGEETAQVAFGPMLGALPADAVVHGVIEVDADTDRLPLAHADGISWRFRHGASAERSTTLVEALRALDLPAEAGHAYIAGEAKTCAVARRHLAEERHWPARSTISIKPFWTPGKRGLE